MTLNKLRKLVNPFWASVMLLVIIAAKAALVAAGFAHASLLYALIPLPVAILAYTGGMLLIVAASAATVLSEMLIVSALSSDDTAAALSAFGPLEQFLTILACGTAIWMVCIHFRNACREQSGLAEDYLRKLYLQRKENASALHDAESHVQRCMEDIDKYSSLVLLLQEAAEKIYSNLDAQSLIDSFFLVLRKCMDAETGSIYFLDEDGRHYTLHASFGYGPGKPYDQPEVIPAEDPLLQYVAGSRHAVALYEDAAPDPGLAKAVPESAIRVVLTASLPSQDKVAGIVNIHSFRERAPRDYTRDTALLSMLCNITSIALTNANLYMKVQDMAVRDPLTKLFNRRYFYDRLSAELSKCRVNESSACVLLCDIDFFKSVNDKYGHQAGDAVLVGFADVCRKIIRDCDVLARYGGEEFIFLLPGLTAQEAWQAAQRIRRTIAATAFTFDGLELKVTTSCGVAAFPQHASDVASLTQAADLALYAAKAAGRNTVVMTGTAPDCSTQTVSNNDALQQVRHEEGHP